MSKINDGEATHTFLAAVDQVPMNDIGPDRKACTGSQANQKYQSESRNRVESWIQACSESQEHESSQLICVKPNGWTRKNLAPYRRYNKLYGERKYARENPGQPFRFLELPGELRNQVYQYFLCFDSVELSAKADDDMGNRRAINHHMKIYKRQIKPRLRLLRVNKQINREAASIFYGENEFRFSSMHGHEMLLAFCRTIGKRNTSYLRKIVEHAPWAGQYDEPTLFRDRPAHSNVTSWGRFRGLLFTMGLHEKGYGAWNFNIMRTLTRHNGGIVKYSIVLPDQFRLAQSRGFAVDNVHRSLLAGIKKGSKIQVSVVKLYPSKRRWTWDVVLRTQEDKRKLLEAEALANGWHLESALLDEFGNYHLDTKSRLKEAGSGVIDL